MNKTAKRMMYLVLTASILLGVFYNVQYYYGAIHWDSMTRKAYFDSFGRVRPSAHFNQYLQTPDYDDALLGRPEKLKSLHKKETLQQIIERIKSDPKWYDLVKEKAQKRKISVDSMLKLDARYVLKNE